MSGASCARGVAPFNTCSHAAQRTRRARATQVMYALGKDDLQDLRDEVKAYKVCVRVCVSVCATM
jgi:hypothetical protein